MCKKRETLLYKVSLSFNDLFFKKFKYIEFKKVVSILFINVNYKTILNQLIKYHSAQI